MVDTLTPSLRSERMGLIRSKGSKAEMTVRSLAHSLGYRFRLHVTTLPGKPDLVFPRLKKIIFVHGCFWHRHACPLGRVPKSRIDFWLPKLEKNRERDEANRAALTALGWDQLVLWECQLKDRDALLERLSVFLGG
jgi:DNA mismatch endonuclease (patch repair protein)